MCLWCKFMFTPLCKPISHVLHCGQAHTYMIPWGVYIRQKWPISFLSSRFRKFQWQIPQSFPKYNVNLNLLLLLLVILSEMMRFHVVSQERSIRWGYFCLFNVLYNVATCTFSRTKISCSCSILPFIERILILSSLNLLSRWFTVIKKNEIFNFYTLGPESFLIQFLLLL